MADALEYLQINDFSPGIRQLVRVPTVNSSPQQLGSADAASTWRCMALPRGGIGPLPKRTTLYTRSAIVAVGGLVVPNFSIIGFHVSQVRTDGSPEIHLAYEYEETTNSKKRIHWDRVVDAYDSPATDNILALDLGNNTATGKRSGGWFAEHISAASLASITSVGSPVVSFAFGEPNATPTSTPYGNWYVTEPGSASLTPRVMQRVDGSVINIRSTHLVQHQGRIAVVNIQVATKGTVGAVLMANVLRYSYPNWVELHNTQDFLQFAQGIGSSYGVGVMESGSISELFIVMHKGGALLIMGDLDSPTVQAMPSVMSTHGAVTKGCFTPVGFVYGVKDGGIYVWAGGGASEKLSVDLEDNFWDIAPTSSPEWLFNGKFATWDDWILTPNNWVFDTITKSWWRMDNPSDVQVFQFDTAPGDSSLLGTPLTYTDSDDPIVYRWQKRTLASSYRWRSNVLQPTIDRWVNVREITIRAVGITNSTVTVTISNEAGESQAETFTLSSATVPKLYRKATNLQGSAIKVQIDADSLTTDAAPVVFEVNLGIRPSARAAT